MKQVVQPVSGDRVEVLDVPRPVPDATEVLVRTVTSVISPGTERAVTALARSSLLAQALKKVADPHPKVRLQLAFTLGESQNSEVLPALAVKV